MSNLGFMRELPAPSPAPAPAPRQGTPTAAPRRTPPTPRPAPPSGRPVTPELLLNDAAFVKRLARTAHLGADKRFLKAFAEELTLEAERLARERRRSNGALRPAPAA
jgi:hypothetical protein